MKELQIAFVGNPNVGKSAWINLLSDAHFKVGNWPGVTVEKKEAMIHWQGNRYHLIDLPGTYTLDDGKNEEGITTRYLAQEPIDLIVNVVDATNLERNLYLTLKLRQLHIPMILIFNFMDEVQRYHIKLDLPHLQEALQIDIYPYSALDANAKEILIEAIVSHAGKQKELDPCVCEKDRIFLSQLELQLQKQLPLYVEMTKRELHQFAYEVFCQKPQAWKQLQAWEIQIQSAIPIRTEEEYLFSYIQELMCFVIDPQERLLRTRKLDALFLHPVYGSICLLLISTVLMLFVFQGSAPFNDFIDFLINEMAMKYANALFFFLPESAKDLLMHGILAGVGGVLVFVPLMTFLYLVLSYLEESGYMSRIAYLLDSGMRHFHLNGKSFVSLLLGFGCNVPAVYATRTLDHEKQKKLTALLVPFMSCGARLPVYMVFAAAFFPGKASILIFSLYGVGILIAFLVALLCSRFACFRDEELLVMELPPYRLPSFRIIKKKVIEEIKAYVHKATSVVLWAMVVLWGLTYFPGNGIEQSYLAQLGKALTPLYEPLGFGTRWECVAALPGSIIAKETVVGFLDQVLLHEERQQLEPIAPTKDVKKIAYELGSTMKSFIFAFVPHPPKQDAHDSLISAIGDLWNDPLANLRAYSFMVYLLLTIPCIMTLQALGKEYGLKLCLLSIGLMLLLPYVIAFFLFQGFSLLF